jgi:PAS domain S-box-containing protein
MKKGILAPSVRNPLRALLLWASLLATAAPAAAAVRGVFGPLFSENYLPHRFCYLAQPGLIWTNVLADGLIAASYTSLFLCILIILRQLRGVTPLRPYLWIFLSFATFIMACGTTHYMDVVTVWWPFYPISAAMKVLCAAVSVPTAIFFARVTPVIVSKIVRFFELLHSAQLAVVEAEDCRDQIEAIDRSQMMVEFNMDGTILRANDAVLRRFGYTHEQLVGQNHSILLNDEDKATTRHQELWAELRRGNFQSGEFRRIGAGGREVWVEVRYTPICGPDGLPRKVVAFATDETDRVNQRIASQHRIREAEARLRAIVDNVLVGIVMLDEKGSILSMNRTAVEIFACPPGTTVGENIAILVPGESVVPAAPGRKPDAAGSKREAAGSSREMEGLARDGRRFPIEVTVSEIIGTEPRTFVSLVRDISQRKLADSRRQRQEEALRRSEELLERTGRLAGIGGWELDLATSTLTWTAETYRILGAQPYFQPTLDAALEMYPEKYRRLVAEAIERAQQDGQGWDIEIEARTLDGRNIWARAVGVAELVDGKPVRLWGAFQDITAQVASRKALEEANLRASLAAASGFIGVWDWDIPGNTLVWDDWMWRLYGLEPRGDAPVPFRTWIDRIHRDDRRAVEQSLLDVVAEGRLYDHQFRILWSDGTLRHIRATGRFIADSAGRAVRMVGHNIDITARKLAEEALRKSEAFLERTGRVAGVGGWEIDLATSAVIWSPETYRILGADTSYKPTLDASIDLYAPESKPVIRAAIAKAYTHGEGWDLELQLVGVDGRQMWARAVGVVDFADGQPVRLWGAFQDITARVAERLALQEANTRASIAAESGGIGIWDWDVNTNKFTCDATMYRLYGLRPEVKGRFDFEFWAHHVHPEDRLFTEPALREAMEGGMPFDREFRIVWDNGTIRHIRATAKITHDRELRPMRVIGTNTDITDRVAEREALKAANTRAQLATQSSGIAIWDWDLATGKITADDAMYRIVGLDPDKYRLEQYEEWASHVHPDDRARVEQALQNGIDEKTPYDIEYRILWADGSLHNIKATGQVVHDAAGKPVRMVGTNKDITPQKRLKRAA